MSRKFQEFPVVSRFFYGNKTSPPLSLPGGSCQHLALRRVVARRVGALLRAAELRKWSLQDVQVTCLW